MNNETASGVPIHAANATDIAYDNEFRVSRIVAGEILGERMRQISAEGYLPQGDDDNYTSAELAEAASAYALSASFVLEGSVKESEECSLYPANMPPFKHGCPRRMLVKAAALIIAQIEQIDRRVKYNKSADLHARPDDHSET